MVATGAAGEPPATAIDLRRSRPLYLREAFGIRAARLGDFLTTTLGRVANILRTVASKRTLGWGLVFGGGLDMPDHNRLGTRPKLR